MTMNESLPFRALSLWQPHATAIALGLKTFETRSWPTNYRGPLVVHAAKRPFRAQDYERGWYDEACTRLAAAGCAVQSLPYGEAVCLVDLVECVPTLSLQQWLNVYSGFTVGRRFWGDFTPGRFAFRLENVRRISPAVKVAGRQGFFTVDIPRGNAALEESLG